MNFFVMAGLTLIVFAWIIQLLEVWKLDKKINLWFIFFYALGSIFLVIDSIISKNIDIALFNLLTVVFSGIIFAIILSNLKNKKK
jgi:hypothetical protein